MSRFSQAFRTSATAPGSVLELIGPTSRYARLVELGVSVASQVAASFGLGYAAAQGLTPTTPTTFLSESQDTSACTIQGALAWATAPAAPGNAYYYRRGNIPLGSTDPVVWTWASGSGLWLLPSTSLALYLFATGPVMDVWAVFEQ